MDHDFAARVAAAELGCFAFGVLVIGFVGGATGFALFVFLHWIGAI